MTGRCWMCGRPRGPSPDGLGSHCRRKLATHRTTTDRPAVWPGHTQPALEDTVTTDRPNRDALIDEYGRATVDPLGDLNAFRHKLAEVTAEAQLARDEQFIAWLIKKSRDSRNSGESTEDYLIRLADKVRRGAIR